MARRNGAGNPYQQMQKQQAQAYKDQQRALREQQRVAKSQQKMQQAAFYNMYGDGTNPKYQNALNYTWVSYGGYCLPVSVSKVQSIMRGACKTFVELPSGHSVPSNLSKEFARFLDKITLAQFEVYYKNRASLTQGTPVCKIYYKWWMDMQDELQRRQAETFGVGYKKTRRR